RVAAFGGTAEVELAGDVEQGAGVGDVDLPQTTVVGAEGIAVDRDQPAVLDVERSRAAAGDADPQGTGGSRGAGREGRAGPGHRDGPGAGAAASAAVANITDRGSDRAAVTHGERAGADITDDEGEIREALSRVDRAAVAYGERSGALVADSEFGRVDRGPGPVHEDIAGAAVQGGDVQEHAGDAAAGGDVQGAGAVVADAD